MKTISKKSTLICILTSCGTALLLGIGGCSYNQAHGPQFRAAAAPSTRALIYIYRPADKQGGYNKSYNVTANDVRLPNIQFNGYYSHEVNPGHLHLAAGPRIENGGLAILDQAIDVATTKAATLDLDVKAGQIYYVRFFREMTMWGPHAPQLILTPRSEAEEKIQNCNLIVQ